MSTEQAPLLTLTDEAFGRLLKVRAGDPQPDRLVLRVAVSGEQDGRYAHDMSFHLRAECEGDVLLHHDDLTVAVPQDNAEKLRGATIDVTPDGQSWVIDNPNRPKRALPLMPVGGHGAGGHEGHAHAQADPQSAAVGVEVPEHMKESLKGDVAQRVATVLEEHINPAIAAHGGHADLAGIEGGTAYLQLSGGCQGCGMAKVTLKKGIETALLDLVPEITEVADITDHSSGENPYYAAEG